MDLYEDLTVFGDRSPSRFESLELGRFIAVVDHRSYGADPSL
jgi:hypothetical protein